MQHADFNARGLHHILSQLIRIRIGVNYTLYSGVDKNLRANNAGLVRTIHSAAVNRHAMISSLHNSILLRMNAAAQLVHLAGGHMELLTQTACNLTVRQILRCTVVACRHNLLVLDNHSTHAAAQTG